MTQSDFWQNFINKRVDFRFMREELHFDLSQSLFSSADVDIGSRFLLRTIVQNVVITGISSVLDIGCGVGVLGLSLKKINPDIQLVAQDRDALAQETGLIAAARRPGSLDFQLAVLAGGLDERPAEVFGAILGERATSVLLARLVDPRA